MKTFNYNVYVCVLSPTYSYSFEKIPRGWYAKV